MLFQLPDDAARQLAALLLFDDLETLSSVSHAAHASAFRASFRSRACLLLPPKREAVAQALVGTPTPSQLSSFQWIQVATQWHVELLSQSHLVVAVHSIRVVSIHRDDVAALNQICIKLPKLLHLRRLDMKKTEIKDVSPLAAMTQLRELDLSSTAVKKVACLETLTNLEVLTLDQTRVDDMNCIKNMQQLRQLTFRRWIITSAVFPPLCNLSNLQELRLGNLLLERLENLLPATGSLRKLSTSNINPSGHKLEARLQWASDFGSRLHKLESIDVRDNWDFIGPALPNFDCLPHLRSIGHPIDCDRELNQSSTSSLMDLEELSLSPDSHQMLQPPASDEYTVLQRLSKLKSVKFDIKPKYQFFTTAELRETHNQRANLHVQALFDVIGRLPNMKRLEYTGYTDGHGSLAKLRRLEHLSVRDFVPKGRSFDWIVVFSSLRSLTVFNSMPGFDYSAIGELTQLKTLDLDNIEHRSDDFAFVSQLVNLESLSLRGQVFDFGCLRGLQCLKSLTIQASSQSGRKIENVGVLGSLQRLRFVDISRTPITDVSVLSRLPRLQSAAISRGADCTPLTEFTHPTLLYVVHNNRDCRWSPRPSCVKRRQWLRDQPASST